MIKDYLEDIEKWNITMEEDWDLWRFLIRCKKMGMSIVAENPYGGSGVIITARLNGQEASYAYYNGYRVSWEVAMEMAEKVIEMNRVAGREEIHDLVDYDS